MILPEQILNLGMLGRVVGRYFHTQRNCFAAEKSLLAALRKKTGYTFANCKKALEMHNNDLQQAEKWLRKQAQELGWSKATKLEGRQTSQGLVGVTVDRGNAALVEVNCETDFVARNKEFKRMVEKAVKTCLAFTKNQKLSPPLTKISLTSEELKMLQTEDGKTLGDILALMIGTVGENATVRRALCLKAANDIKLVGYAHPSSTEDTSVLLGRFGGIVALKPFTTEAENIDEVGKGICQHVVGMAPKKIGTSDDEPSQNKDDETCLIHQEYLLDETVTIKELLEENNVEVVDFERFECGESIIRDQPLDYVETCQ